MKSKNSNWNNNKKNKKAITEQQWCSQSLLQSVIPWIANQNSDNKMVWPLQVKRIKREPAEIVKKLFMMGVMAT